MALSALIVASLIGSCAVPIEPSTRSGDAGTIAFVRSAGRTAELLAVDVASGRIRQLDVAEGRVSTPAWSPDGGRLAYAQRNPRTGEGFAVEILDMATGTTERVSPGLRIEGSPTWAPDGRSLAFSANLDGPSFGVYIVHLEGGPRRRLVDGQSPAWSARGDLAFVRIEQDGPRVYRVDPGDANAVPVAITGTEHAGEQDPSWSPDGKRLAVSTLGPQGDWDIAIIDVDTGDRHVIELPGTDERHPTWSPDGASIAVSRIDEEAATIWILDPAGDAQRQLTHGPLFDVMPAWRPPPDAWPQTNEIGT